MAAVTASSVNAQETPTVKPYSIGRSSEFSRGGTSTPAQQKAQVKLFAPPNTTEAQSDNLTSALNTPVTARTAAQKAIISKARQSVAYRLVLLQAPVLLIVVLLLIILNLQTKNSVDMCVPE